MTGPCRTLTVPAVNVSPRDLEKWEGKETPRGLETG